MDVDRLRGERIFQKLLRVAPALREVQGAATSKVVGLMDLNLDVLERRPGYLRIALSHYYKHPSGDLIPDPDMEVAAYLHDGRAEALTYQDALIYDLAYPTEGEPPDPAAYARLNVFLEQWLDNLAEQGHVL